MKKYFYIAAAALIAVVACQKNSSVEENSPLQSDGTKTAITFGTNVVSKITKGEGPLDNWGEQTLWVYGFSRDHWYDENPTFDAAHAYINCVPATAPASGTEGTIKVYDYDKLPFFYEYTDNIYTTYDFYGLYVDDAVVEDEYEYEYEEGKTIALPTLKDIIMDGTTISVPFEIDGTQDLMIAHADREKQLGTYNTDHSDNQIADKGYLYSGYTARKGLHPNLEFEHKLTRFDFKVKIGVGSSLTEGELEIEKMTIDSYTKGTLYVASTDPGTHKPGVEADNSPESEKDLEIHFTPNAGETFIVPAAATEFGKVMVITPDENLHNLKLTFRQKVALTDAEFASWKARFEELNGEEPVVDTDYFGESGSYYVYKTGLTTTHELTPAMVTEAEGSMTEENPSKQLEKFEVGHRYIVTMVIYGLEKIEIKVTLVPWEDAGFVWIDPDEDPFGYDTPDSDGGDGDEGDGDEGDGDEGDGDEGDGDEGEGN